MLGDGFLDWLREQDDRTKTGLIAQLEERERALIRHDWPLWRREAQSPPRGAWNCWVICAGRGFGKTRTGAEWVRECAILDPDARIALVAAGRFDASVSPRPKSDWDLAAADIIMSEAGGLLTDHAGQPYRYNTDTVQCRPPLAAGPRLHALLRDRLQNKT